MLEFCNHCRKDLPYGQPNDPERIEVMRFSKGHQVIGGHYITSCFIYCSDRCLLLHTRQLLNLPWEVEFPETSR